MWEFIHNDARSTDPGVATRGHTIMRGVSTPGSLLEVTRWCEEYQPRGRYSRSHDDARSIDPGVATRGHTIMRGVPTPGSLLKVLHDDARSTDPGVATRGLTRLCKEYQPRGRYSRSYTMVRGVPTPGSVLEVLHDDARSTDPGVGTQGHTMMRGVPTPGSVLEVFAWPFDLSFAVPFFILYFLFLWFQTCSHARVVGTTLVHALHECLGRHSCMLPTFTEW